MNASFDGTVSGVTVSKTATPAKKTWIKVRLLLTPESATNEVGKEHTFTATLESTTDGTNWTGVEGKQISFSWSGVLSGNSTEATNSSGKATKALTSNDPGMLTMRSEERRAGKECRARWSPYQ